MMLNDFINPEDQVLSQALDGNMDKLLSRNVTEEWFTDAANQKLFSVLQRMNKEQGKVECNTVLFELQASKELGLVGGPGRVVKIADSALPEASTAYWLDVLEERKLSRECVGHAEELKAMSLQSDGRLSEFIVEMQNYWNDISPISLSSERSIKEGVVATTEILSRRWTNDSETPFGLPTGISSLDEFLGGMEAGAMVVIGARPSVGKTSLGIQIANDIVFRQGKAVTFFSLEMNMEQLISRLVAIRSEVPLKNLDSKTASQRDFAKISHELAEIAKSKLRIIDNPGVTASHMRNIARKHKAQHNIEAIFVDYLQLVKAEQGTVRAESRASAVGEISRGIKQMAMELNIPVIAMAQLNREFEKDGGRAKPRMSDLRESGSIEADADVCMFLYEKPPSPDIPKKEGIKECKITIAKNRNGRANDEVDLEFNESITRFEQSYYPLRDGVGR